MRYKYHAHESTQALTRYPQSLDDYKVDFDELASGRRTTDLGLWWSIADASKNVL